MTNEHPQEFDGSAGFSGRCRDASIRAAVYGTGSWANQTHIPNLKKLGVDVVAACDVDAAALRRTAERFEIPAVYADGREMIEKERFDVLYSIVPAFARTDVEIRAVERGIHLFSEKPQALRMAVALEIDRAVRKCGRIEYGLFSRTVSTAVPRGAADSLRRSGSYTSCFDPWADRRRVGREWNRLPGGARWTRSGGPRARLGRTRRGLRPVYDRIGSR